MAKSTSSSALKKHGKTKIKGRAIAGIVIGAIVLIILLILVALIIRHMRKKKAQRTVTAV